MGLSAADKRNAQDSWAAANNEWGTNGIKFYQQMFQNNPEIKTAFANADLSAQPAAFAAMVSSWMSGLDNDAALKATMNGFCTSHKGRGNTNMGLFKAALGELGSFLKSTTGLTAAQEASWGNVSTAILASMTDGFSHC